MKKQPQRVSYRGLTIARSYDPSWPRWGVLWPDKVSWHKNLASAKAAINSRQNYKPRQQANVAL